MAYFLQISWRKWPDPIVDFGRELYTPWRLAEGAVLYRDVDDFYGPLSQTINAGLFRVFGPGMMVLVAANLAIFAAIAATLYWLARKAWGPTTGFAAGAVFIAVFGFSRYVTGGNFNYATPYAHETTHGVLVLVLLVAAAQRYLERPGYRWSAVVGLLGGTTLVLKPEIAFAGAAVTIALLAFETRHSGKWPGRHAAVILAAGAAPTLFFIGWFWGALGFEGAVFAAGRAWLTVIATTHYTNDPFQWRASGFDAPWRHLLQHGEALLVALGLIGWIAVAAKVAERGSRVAWVGGWAAVAVLALASSVAPAVWWIEVGRCFAGLVFGYLILGVVRLRAERGKMDSRWRLRMLLGVLAAALLMRMALNGRVYHYGFFQAALAGVVIVAVLVGELPGRVGRTPVGRAVAVAGALAVLVPGVVILTNISRRNYATATFAVGKGRDRFLAPPEIAPIAQTVAFLAQLPRGQTLVVLPEGLMINYLARVPSPVAGYFFHSGSAADGSEEKVVSELDRHPPDWLLTLPLDLREYGIGFFGERSGAGRELLAWARANYEGPPPLRRSFEFSTEASRLFHRKSPAAPQANP